MPSPLVPMSMPDVAPQGSRGHNDPELRRAQGLRAGGIDADVVSRDDAVSRYVDEHIAVTALGGIIEVAADHIPFGVIGNAVAVRADANSQEGCSKIPSWELPTGRQPDASVPM